MQLKLFSAFFQNAVLAQQCLASTQVQPRFLMGNFHSFSALDVRGKEKQNKTLSGLLTERSQSPGRTGVLATLRNNSKVIWGSCSGSFLSAYRPIPALG